MFLQYIIAPASLDLLVRFLESIIPSTYNNPYLKYFQYMFKNIHFE